MDAAGALDFAGSIVNHDYPGKWWALELGPHRAFAVETGTALAVLGPKAGTSPQPYLALVCGMAIAIPPCAELHNFVNGENKEAYFGSLYIEPGQGGSASVIAQLLIPYEPLSWEHGSTIQWARTMITTVIGRAAQTAPTLLATCGGTNWPGGYAETLWMMG
jgi:hypothetical protein